MILFGTTAGVFAAASRADELHIGCLNVERVSVIVVAVGPLLDPQTSLDVNDGAFGQVFCRVLGLLSPESDLEPGGNVLQFAGFISSLFVGRHREAAYGDALRGVTEIGVFAQVANDGDLIERHSESSGGDIFSNYSDKYSFKYITVKEPRARINLLPARACPFCWQMKFFIAIFGCILALFAAGIVRPQTLETTKKKPGSDPVKCWSYSDNDVYFRFAAADAKAIYVTTDKGSLIAVDVVSGAKLWSAEFGGEVVSNIVVVDSHVAIATRPSPSTGAKDTTTTLRVLSKETGILAWKAELAGSGPIYLDGAAGIITAASSTGEIAAFDFGSGELKWKLKFAGGLTAVPTVNGSLLIVATGEKRVTGITLSGGESLFSVEVKHPANVVLFEGNSVFMADDRGEILRLDTDGDPKPKWKYRAGARIRGINEVDGQLIASSYDNFLYSIGKGSGHVNWKVRLQDRVRGIAVLDEKRLLVFVENTKTATAVMTESGRIDSQLQLDDAAIAAGSGGGRVYILSPASVSAYSTGACGK